MKSVLFSLLIGFAITSGVVLSQDGPTVEKPLKVYIFAGQSNAAGALASDDPDRSPVGAELSLASTLKSKRDSNFEIIKFTKSGSNLHRDWDPYSNLNEEPNKTNGLKLYNGLINAVTSKIEELSSVHSEVSLEGFVWIQGESDRSHLRGDEYGANLRNFIYNIRTDLNAPDMIFYLTELSSYPTQVDTEIVRQHQWEIAKGNLDSGVWNPPTDPKVEFIHTSDLSFAEGPHYDRASYAKLGDRLADRIIKTEKQNKPTLKRHELTQYYDQKNKQILATNRLPNNVRADEYYEYRSVLGRLYTFNSASDTRIPLFSCYTGQADNKYIARVNQCDYNAGEEKTLLGWLNSTPSPTRTSLYNCYAPSIKSTVLIRNYTNCNNPVVELGTPPELNPDFLGYIEKDR